MARSGFADLMAICAVIPEVQRHSGAARQDRTRNLAILRCAIAHHSSMLSNRPGMTGKSARPGTPLKLHLRPRPLAADGEQFHRAVRDHDPEGGADGAFDQLDFAAMGADELGGDGEAEPAAPWAAGGLERLEQMLAGLLRHAGAGIGDLQDRDSALAAAGDADLHRGAVAV